MADDSSKHRQFSKMVNSSLTRAMSVRVIPDEENDEYTPTYLANRNFNYDYKLLKQLGQGGFGCVWQCMKSTDKLKVAVKIYFKKCTDRKMAIDEMRTLKLLKHPNIVNFIDYYEDEMCCFVCMEQISGGELFYRIARGKKHNEKHTEKQARIWCTSLLSAVGYCHENGVIHRDIKPENIMMITPHEASDIKVVDFGLSIRTTSYPYNIEEVGTKNYKAPEMNAGSYYNSKVDLWSVGVIVFLLLGGYLPFANASEKNPGDYDMTKIFESKPAIWNKVSPEAKSFISGLLVINPRNRMSALTALSHPWFSMDPEVLGLQELDETLKELRQFNAQRKVEFWIKAWLAKKCAKKWIKFVKNRQENRGSANMSSEVDTMKDHGNSMQLDFSSLKPINNGLRNDGINSAIKKRSTTITYSLVDPQANNDGSNSFITGEIEVPYVYAGLDMIDPSVSPRPNINTSTTNSSSSTSSAPYNDNFDEDQEEDNKGAVELMKNKKVMFHVHQYDSQNLKQRSSLHSHDVKNISNGNGYDILKYRTTSNGVYDDDDDDNGDVVTPRSESYDFERNISSLDRNYHTMISSHVSSSSSNSNSSSARQQDTLDTKMNIDKEVLCSSSSQPRLTTLSDSPSISTNHLAWPLSLSAKVIFSNIQPSFVCSTSSLSSPSSSFLVPTVGPSSGTVMSSTIGIQSAEFDIPTILPRIYSTNNNQQGTLDKKRKDY